MNIILFDDDSRRTLLPLTFTKPVAWIRIGILRISEKWEKLAGSAVGFKTEPYLAVKFNCSLTDDNLFISGAVIPDRKFFNSVQGMKRGSALFSGQRLLACRLSGEEAMNFVPQNYSGKSGLQYNGDLRIIDYPWQIFSWNGEAMRQDFELLTAGRHSLNLSSRNHLSGGGKYICRRRCQG